MKTKQNIENATSPIPRVLAIAAGTLCLITALIFAIMTAMFYYVAHGSLALADYIRIGIFLLFSIFFFIMGIRFCRKQKLLPPREILASYNKHNDGHWCMGAFGLFGGALMILLNYHEVIDLILNHALATMAITYLALGIQSYFFWQWKQKWLKSIHELIRATDTIDLLSSTMTELQALLNQTGTKYPKEFTHEE